MNSDCIVGIVGAHGDLGSRMTIQALKHFSTVLTFDIAESKLTAVAGVDPDLLSNDVNGTSQYVSMLSELLDRSDVIHWCVPSMAYDVQQLRPQQLLLFHDSVMSASKLKVIQQGGITSTVHCLMNAEKRVVIASDIGATQGAYTHIQQLGLSPLCMTAVEHDTDMAHSQAVFAVLVKSLLPDLVRLNSQGMLTGSAYELLKALQHREATWTPATMATMLSNPELPKLIQTLEHFVSDHQNSK